MKSIAKYFNHKIDPWYLKGKQDGRQEAWQEEKRKIIIKLLRGGPLTTEQIAFHFEVTTEYVEALRAEIK